MPHDKTLYGSDQISTVEPCVSTSLCAHSMTAPSWDIAQKATTPNVQSGYMPGPINSDDSQPYSTEVYSDSSTTFGNCIGGAVPPDASGSQPRLNVYEQAARLRSDYSSNHVTRASIIPSNSPLRYGSNHRRRSTSTAGASSDGDGRPPMVRDAGARGSISNGSVSENTGQAGKEIFQQGGMAKHNDIERKYRMNLKDKIAKLRAAVPSLQSAHDGDSDNSGAKRSTPKFSKGTILRRATEYIRELEQVNRAIASENHELVKRTRDLEAMLQEIGVVYHRQHATQIDPRRFQ